MDIFVDLEDQSIEDKCEIQVVFERPYLVTSPSKVEHVPVRTQVDVCATWLYMHYIFFVDIFSPGRYKCFT